jgi:Common central domain of tyrosinase/Polyphenol oxidase middle domain
MFQRQTTRRVFLQQTAVAGAACLAAALPDRVGADAPGPLVRKSIAEFSKDGNLVASLRKGIKKMRELPPDHPFSWVFQANIHWRPFYPAYVYKQADESTDPAQQLFRDKLGFMPEINVFNQCPHGNWWFLPWHRAYLYYFERILRWAAKDPTLALPYWNYSDPDQRELPRVFREPTTDGKPNPLYLPESAVFTDSQGKTQVFPMRDGPLNSFPTALTQLTKGATSLAALRVIAYTNSDPAPASQGFGSPRACDATCGCGSGALESTPHNKVHNAIGGNTVMVGDAFRVGFMGDIATAARDPIFWLHHSNIDRLWESWVQLKGGRLNPEDPDWLNYPPPQLGPGPFTFYDVGPDENPQPAQKRPFELLDIAKLGYKYDKLEDLPTTLAARPAAALGGQAFRPLAVTSKDQTIKLKNTASESVPVAPAEGVTAEHVRAAAAAKPEEQGELLVVLEEVEFQQPPGVYYDVYLSGGAGAEKLTPESPYYLGALTFFGLGQHGGGHGHGAQGLLLSVKFALPADLRKQVADNKLDPKDLQVTFVPQTGTEPVKGKEAPKASPERTVVTIKRVRLVVVR